MMPPEPLPPEVADRLERPRYQPGAMLLGWVPAAGPNLVALRDQMGAEVKNRAGERLASDVMFLEFIGDRARRFIAELRPHLHSQHPQRHAVEHIDFHLANDGGRLVIAAVMLHR